MHYVNNFHIARAVVQKYIKNNKEFRKKMEVRCYGNNSNEQALSDTEACRGLGLIDFMIVPVQRYVLIDYYINIMLEFHAM